MENKKEEKKEVVKHDNIFAALAAFQQENPIIERTKNVSFEAKGKTVSFWYAPLDEVLQTIRPLTSKHGLSIVWEEKDAKLVCAIYHETYETIEEKVSEIMDGGKLTATYKMVEENVIRSMPITVRRAGDMKDIGSDATYARRYTISEVLGIAADEDTDVAIDEARRENIEKFALAQAKKGITESKTVEQIEEKEKFFMAEVKMLNDEKAPKLGFSLEQYIELGEMCSARKAQLSKVAKKEEVIQVG